MKITQEKKKCFCEWVRRKETPSWRHRRVELMLYCEPPSFSKSKNRVRVSCIDRLLPRVRRFQQVRRQLFVFYFSRIKMFLRLFFLREKEYFRGKTRYIIICNIQKTQRRKEIKNIKKKLRCVACLRVCAWKIVLRSVTLSLSISLVQFFFLKFSQNNKLVRTCWFATQRSYCFNTSVKCLALFFLRSALGFSPPPRTQKKKRKCVGWWRK